MELKLSINLISIINFLGVAQAFFFSIILFKLRKPENKPHLYLAFFLLAYGLVQLNDVMEDSNLFLIIPHLSSIFPALVFILGPLIYFYVQALVIKDFKFRPKYILHFIPFVLILLLQIPYFVLDSVEKSKVLLDEYQHPEQSLFFSYIGIIQVMIYLIFSIKSIIKFSRDIKNYFSYTEKISLKWLVNLMVSLVIIWTVWLLDTQYPILFLKYLEAIMFTFFIYFLGLKGINQPEIFKKMVVADQKPFEPVEMPQAKKYEKSGISSDIIEECVLKLKKSMDVDKVYKNNQLTLSELANLIEIQSHHLSQLLNENLNSNFYDYVNGYRIQEVKEELLDPKNNNYTILALALEAGFSSKASFNKAFRKYTCLSPSEYKSQNLKKEVSPY